MSDTLREAWDSLATEFHEAGRNIAPDRIIARHRPIIEAALRASAEAAPGPLDALAGARATIEAMSGDAADLTDLIGEAAAMRTVLGHMLSDRGRIHDSGCGICDAGRALLVSDHELPSAGRASAEAAPGPLDVEMLARAICWDWGPEGGFEAETIHVDDECRAMAQRIAREYARLAAAPEEGS